MKTTLHLFNRGLDHAPLMERLLSLVLPGDALLLIENAVVWACHERLPQWLETSGGPISVSALSADLQARGLLQRVRPPIRLATDDEFVRLAAHCQRSVSWY